MSRPRVWAPTAKSVDLVLPDRRVPLSSDSGGWWLAAIELAQGSDYQFAVDGGDARPDPRSPWQPQGVHGPSRSVEASDFAWSDADWQAPGLEGAVLYELHLGTFTERGTFTAVVEKLDHLCELGVTHLELMPIGEFSGVRGWGYDGVDLFAPHHAYGTPDDLKRLVDACHSRGLAVLLDVVYNHLGPCGNYLASFGPYFTERHHTPWGSAVNLDDAHCDGVREFFIDNALMWLRDYHFDGLRLDAVHALLDTSATHFLEQLSRTVKSLAERLGRPLILIAESNQNDPRLVRSSPEGGYGLDATWSDDFHHAVHALLTGERDGYYADFGSLAQLAKCLTHGFVYDGAYSSFRKRRVGASALGLPASQLVCCVQNHDQVGNRARGERLSHLLDGAGLKVAAALLMCSPFTPLLFQGEEWGASSRFPYFTAHPEAELAEAVRQGRQREFAHFGWQPQHIPDPQALSTFEAAKLKWSEVGDPSHAAVLRWYQSLIEVRRKHLEPAQHVGEARVRFDEAGGWLTVERANVVSAFNLGREPQSVPLPFQGHVLLASDEGIKPEGPRARLPARSTLILGRDA